LIGASVRKDTHDLLHGDVIDVDICIVGAGPAGITLARDLIQSGFKVALLESGGSEQNFDTQQLSAGELSGELYEPQELTHIRQVGGTANHMILKMADKQFGYRYSVFEAIDFEKREGIPNSGWPITKAELDPYYEKAQSICEIGHYDYDPEYWLKDGDALLPLAQEKAQNSVFMFGPTRKFSQDFPKEISESENVVLYEFATVVELICHDEDIQSVDTALVRTFDQKEIFFKARYFIIAANAIQTPRLLLNSKRDHPTGLGNQFDNVGRYYFDHSLVASGSFVPHDARYINLMGFYDMQGVKGASVLGKIVLSPEVMRQEKLRNAAFMLFPNPLNNDDVAAMSSIQALMAHIRTNWKAYPAGMGGHLKNILKGWKGLFRAVYENVRYQVPFFIGLARGGWSKIKNSEKKYDRLNLLAIVEQIPFRDNRVTLTDEIDALGCPRAKIHYEFSKDDIASVKRVQEILGEALTETGLGTYDPPKESAEVIRQQTGIHHMMGTTRMSEDPKEGVVDRDCRIHGFRNIFIAGSATFATGSYANPTLTNIALSLRISEKVQTLMND
jgi:choline dehydrogenase-like flavoprotein